MALWTPSNLASTHYELYGTDATFSASNGLSSWNTRNSTTNQTGVINTNTGGSPNNKTTDGKGVLFGAFAPWVGLPNISANPSSSRTYWALTDVASGTIFGSSQSGGGQLRISQSKLDFLSQFVSDYGGSSGTIATSGLNVLIAVFDKSAQTIRYRINGADSGTLNGVTLSSTGTLDLFVNGSSNGENLGGSCYDIGLVESVLASTNQDDDLFKLEGYLAWYEGLGGQSNLPANHPYKNAAPTTGGTSLPISGSYAIVSTSTGALGMSAAISGTYPVSTTGAGTLGLTAPLSGSYALTSASSGMVGNAGLLQGMYGLTVAATGALGMIGPLAGASAIYSSAAGAIGGGTGITLFVYAPGSIVQAAPVALVSALTLSTTSFPAVAAIGTVLASVNGTLDGDSIVSITQSDNTDVFRVNALGTAVTAGGNYSGRDSLQRVRLTEVNRKALNSPLHSRISVTYN